MSRDQGLDLAQRLYAKGVDVFDGADVPPTEAGLRYPKVIALTLLARTLSEMRAATLLLDHGQVVEARTLVRGMCENLFWAAALARKGDAFVEEMKLDDVTSRKARTAGLIEWAKAQDGSQEVVDKLDRFRAGLVEDHGQTWGIKLQQAATAGGVQDYYVVYRELSTDAAHPSAESLSRHVSLNDDEEGPPFIVNAAPNIAVGEAAETVELMCGAALYALVAVNEIVGGVPVGERLAVLREAYVSLSATNKAQRDAVSGSSGSSV